MNAIGLLLMRKGVSDESSSSSDEEWELALQNRCKRICRPRIMGYMNVVQQYSDDEFKSHFRFEMYKNLIEHISSWYIFSECQELHLNI